MGPYGWEEGKNIEIIAKNEGTITLNGKKNHGMVVGKTDNDFVGRSNFENTGNRFKKDIIPDAETACKVAIPIIKAVYGEQQLSSELPLQITLVNDKYWTIEGTLHTAKGGVVFMTINKHNGCVLNLMHGE